MAPLRFRFWHQPENRMYEDMTLELIVSLVEQYGLDKPVSLNAAFELLPKLGIVPMQSTGLKDKNGKDVYEGDVIRREGKLYPVVFINAAFRTGHVVHAEVLASADEIVGNIYEHPHLLNG